MAEQPRDRFLEKAVVILDAMLLLGWENGAVDGRKPQPRDIDLGRVDPQALAAAFRLAFLLV
jgi:hypothetical protein